MLDIQPNDYLKDFFDDEEEIQADNPDLDKSPNKPIQPTMRIEDEPLIDDEMVIISQEDQLLHQQS